MRGQLRHSIIAAGLAGVLVLAGCSSGHHPTANGPGGSDDDNVDADRSIHLTDNDATSPSTRRRSPSSTSTTSSRGPQREYPRTTRPCATPPNAAPPSLAGAYPQGNTVNLITVLKTLATYRTGFGHTQTLPGGQLRPATGPEYSGEVARVTRIRDKGWHADPTPSEILWAKVTRQPLRTEVNGKPLSLNGHAEFSAGCVTVVNNEVPVPMLTASGQPSGQQYNPPQTGQVAFQIVLGQGPDGQFRFFQTNGVNPPGGIAALEGQEVSSRRWWVAASGLGQSARGLARQWHGPAAAVTATVAP